MSETTREPADLDDVIGRLKLLTYETRQVRWYLGLLCVFAAVLLLVVVLVLTGVVTVEFKPVSPSRF